MSSPVTLTPMDKPSGVVSLPFKIWIDLDDDTEPHPEVAEDAELPRTSGSSAAAVSHPLSTQPRT